MFAKVFGQILDSSIADDYETRHVFMDLLVLADAKGIVDMTVAAIARRTGAPTMDMIGRAIDQLCSPDPESRTDREEGRRLVPINAGRSWGWRIVNYEQYREMRDQEARRTYFREYKREARAKMSKCVLDSTALSTEEEEEEEEKKEEVPAQTKAEAKNSLTVTPRSGSGEAIYRAYARQVAKRSALKAIDGAIERLRTGERGDIISEVEARQFLFEKTAAFALSPAGKRGAFTPYPATWFNSSGYLDDEREWHRGEQHETSRRGHDGVSPARSRQQNSDEAIREAFARRRDREGNLPNDETGSRLLCDPGDDR